MRRLVWAVAVLLAGACGGASEVAPASSSDGGSDSAGEPTGGTGMPSSTSSASASAGSESTSTGGTTDGTTMGTSTTMIDIDTDGSASAGSTGGVDPTVGGSTGTTGSSSECTGLFWEVDFTTDPTGIDVNGDMIDDWTLRNGAGFPQGELSGGIWSAGTHEPLDTRPRDDFAVRTRARIEMQSVETGSTRGATFWINVDYSGGNFAPIFVHLNLDDQGTQDLQLFGKTDNATRTLLAEVSDLPAGFVTVELDIDPDTDQVALSVDGSDQGSFAYPTFAVGNNDDRFATLFAWDTDTQFRFARIEQCPNL